MSRTHLSADRVREAEAIFGQLEVGAGPQTRLLVGREFARLELHFGPETPLTRLNHLSRQSYCSMLVGTFRSVGDASLQAGNSEDIIWSDYLDLVDQSEANAFWEIRPTRAPAPLTESPIA